jgi:hypothetical protein
VCVLSDSKPPTLPPVKKLSKLSNGQTEVGRKKKLPYPLCIPKDMTATSTGITETDWNLYSNAAKKCNDDRAQFQDLSELVKDKILRVLCHPAAQLRCW